MTTMKRITLTALLMSGALPMGKKDPLYYRMAKAIFIKMAPQQNLWVKMA